MSTLFSLLRRWCGLLLCCGLSTLALAQPATSPRVLEANLLLLEARLDGSVLSDSVYAYQDGAQILLPLGELARLLTLAITVDPVAGQASGYVLAPERTFGLNVAQSLARLGERETQFEPQRAQILGEDVYVDSRLLSRWLPIDFEVDLPSLQLRVKPREKLPLQARLERERAAARLRALREEADDPGYPRVRAPYRLIDRPFIDQTFGADARFGPDSRQYNSAYTAYMTADVLGLEGAAYVNARRNQDKTDYRLTLGRNDPDAGLLGPLQARSFMLGNIQVPSVPNVMAGSPVGGGVTVSNRPLNLPTSFDRQSLRGDLPPGWDVTLYYNDALVGFQASRGDGLYAFDDLPLSYGRNDFQLVFNGPLGQVRTERRSFQLDQSIVKPGEFLYALTLHEARDGGDRGVARFDLGLSKSLAGSAAFIQLPRPVAGQTGTENRGYVQLGLRGYWDAAIATSEVVMAPNGGLLGELGLKTRLGSYALDLLHTQLQGGYDSDVFSASGNPVVQRNKLRLLGSLAPGEWLPRIPVALDVQRDQLQSGARNDQVTGRFSFMAAGTSFTNGLSWLHSSGVGQPSTVRTTGSLQLSRRVAGMGLSGQLGYSLRPDNRLDTVALAADRNLSAGYRVNAGLLHDMNTNQSLVSGGVSKNLGRYALAISGSYSDRKEAAVAVQLFIALGRNPRSGEWFSDALPLAGTGSVSALAFVDRNLNGIRDPGEEFVPNAGFIVNRGGRYPVRTDDSGTLMINRLAPGRYADIALDPATLEDPQWKPVREGVRVLPRPGLVQALEFPVATTTDIDGTVYLRDRNGRRGIGDAQLELVDALGIVVMRVRSSSDGFYTLHQVMPGRYVLRIAREQLAKLRLVDSGALFVEVKPDSDFINGLDLELTPLAP